MTRANSRFSTSPYHSRFGSWVKTLEAFVVWANGGGLPPEKPADASARGKRKVSLHLRALVLMRDGATCRMCGARPENGAKLHIDHIVPWAKGGQTVLDNLQVLCEQCNRGKRDFQPVETEAMGEHESPGPSNAISDFGLRIADCGLNSGEEPKASSSPAGDA